MNRQSILIALLLLVYSCSHQPSNQTTAKQVRDTVIVVVRDTLVMLPATVPPPPPPLVKHDTPKTQLQQKPKPKPEVAEHDTTFYYYETGKLSVKITPWNSGKRSILFYDRKGELTY
ncbi:MAG: hypothetical protein U0T75_03530 [Chitinophagales bacterium]